MLRYINLNYTCIHKTTSKLQYTLGQHNMISHAQGMQTSHYIEQVNTKKNWMT